MELEKSSGRSWGRNGVTWSRASIISDAFVWLEGTGIDVSQFASDVQLLGVGTAVMRLMFGIGANFRQPSG